MSRRLNPEILLLLAFFAAVPVRAWEVSGGAAPDDFQAFHRRFSSDVYFYPRHGAAPLGLIGFETGLITFCSVPGATSFRFSFTVLPVQVNASPCNKPASSNTFITRGTPPTRSRSAMT